MVTGEPGVPVCFSFVRLGVEKSLLAVVGRAQLQTLYLSVTYY